MPYKLPLHKAQSKADNGAAKAMHQQAQRLAR